MIRIAVVNLKGGSGKTTTAGMLAAAFHETGLSTLGVDADGENKSLQGWQVAADLPFPVTTQAVANLHTVLPGVIGDRFEVVVCDTPPMQAQKGTVLSAMRWATHVIVPLAPSPIERDRLPAVKELLEESATLRADGRPPYFAAFLIKCKARSASPAVYRELIEEDDKIPVLKAQVPDRERFVQAWGSPIKRASLTAFGDAAMELMELGD
jgi:chromosome partitioning protein